MFTNIDWSSQPSLQPGARRWYFQVGTTLEFLRAFCDILVRCSDRCCHARCVKNGKTLLIWSVDSWIGMFVANASFYKYDIGCLLWSASRYRPSLYHSELQHHNPTIKKTSFTWQVRRLCYGLIKAYNITIKKVRHRNETTVKYTLCGMGSKFNVKIQRCPFKFHSKIWTNMRCLKFDELCYLKIMISQVLVRRVPGQRFSYL